MRSGRDKSGYENASFMVLFNKHHVPRLNLSTWVSASISIYPCVCGCGPTVYPSIHPYFHTHTPMIRPGMNETSGNLGKIDIPMGPLMF